MASVRLAAGAAGLFGAGTVTNLPSVVAWAERPHTAGMAPTHSSSGSAARRPLEAVVFDLDGVLIEGEGWSVPGEALGPWGDGRHDGHELPGVVAIHGRGARRADGAGRDHRRDGGRGRRPL